MSGRSGTGPIELALLQAATAASPSTGDRVLAQAEADAGLGPRYAYEMLLDLARHWVISLPLIAANGSYDNRIWPAAEPRRIECRPSHTGQLVLDAEAGHAAPVPVGLINGTAYRGGLQPPLNPGRAIAALRHLLARPDAPDRDILAIAGPPHPVTDAIITGDLDGLAAGKTITLRQTSRITRTTVPVPATAPDRPPASGPPAMRVTWSSDPGDRWLKGHLIIESMPPGIRISDITETLIGQARDHDRAARNGQPPAGLPISDLPDASTSRIPVRLAIVLRPGTDPDTVRDQLTALDGITTETPAAYPAPLAQLLRDWTRHHSRHDIAAALTSLEQAIQRDRD